MTLPVSRPFIRAVAHHEAGDALERLINVAGGDTGGARRVAEFLLSWWEGTAGLISMADLCYLDAETREDILIILAYIAQNDVTYADAWGRGQDMGRLIDQWNWKGRGGS